MTQDEVLEAVFGIVAAIRRGDDDTAKHGALDIDIDLGPAALFVACDLINTLHVWHMSAMNQQRRRSAEPVFDADVVYDEWCGWVREID